MKTRLSSGFGLFLLAVIFLLIVLLGNLMFGGVRLDLTENRLYTLSDGSREIVESIDEPLTLYFFFSDKASQDLTALRGYAQRVQELLQRYQSLARGKIRLQIIDPEPFSDQEDQATLFGLQAIPLPSGNELYFGLAGTNALDDHEVIPFFQPDKEEFLEYEISRLLQSLARPERPTVGLMSSISLNGDVNPQTFQTTPPYIVVEQLSDLVTIQDIDAGAAEISDEIDVLVIVHPKNLADETLRAIDQFAMRGGRILAFVDPLAEMDRPAQMSPMMPAPSGQSSDLNRLTSAWGVTLRDGQFIGDGQIALQVSGASGRPIRHLGILGLGPDNLSREDVVTSRLEMVNLASAGILDVSADRTTDVVPLMLSTQFAMPLDVMQLQMMSDPQDLQQGFDPTGEQYTLAARISGTAQSAFKDQAPTGEAEFLDSTTQLNVILVADTDLLSDRMWVQVQDFFGQRIASAWANNGDLVVNAVDNLVGSASLISVRSRGRFTRPFDVVQDLRREAEARYLQSANDLQAQLADTESKLSELEAQREESNLLGFSPEQAQALDKFQEEKLRIRKQLRDVRHQLDRDIEALGSQLKFLNIFLVPVLLTLFLLAFNYVRLRKRISDE